MAEVKWIKITTDMFDDEKIKIIQSLPEGDSILVIWVRLIILAGKTNANGYVYINENLPYTEETLSIIFNKPISIIKLALQTFSSLKMIENDIDGIYLINFEKYQNIDGLDRIREQNRLRKQKQREKQKMLNSHVTSRDSHATDIEKEEEKNKNLKNKKMRQENLPLESLSSQTLSSHEEQARERRTYGEYHNVILDDEQYDKLSKEFPEDLKERIDNLSTYLETTGKEYNSHYAVIRFWAKKEAKKAKKAGYKPSVGAKDSRIFRGEQKPVTDDEYDLLVL